MTTYRTTIDNPILATRDSDVEMGATRDSPQMKKKRRVNDTPGTPFPGVDETQKPPEEMTGNLFPLDRRNDHRVPLHFFCRADDLDARDHFKDRSIRWFGRNFPGVGLVPRSFVFSGGLEGDMIDYLHELMMDDAKSKMFVMDGEDYQFLRDETRNPNLRWFVSFDVFYKFEADLQCMEKGSPRENNDQIYVCLCHFIPMAGGEYVLYANLKMDRSVTIRDLRNEAQKNVDAARKGLDWKGLTWDSAEIRRAYPHGNHPSPADDDLDIYDVIPSAFMTFQAIGANELDSAHNENDEDEADEGEDEEEEETYASLLMSMTGERRRRKNRKRSFANFANDSPRRKRSHSDPAPRPRNSSSCDGQEHRVDK